jgi:hypothetical protein
MPQGTILTSSDDANRPVAPWWHAVLVLVPIMTGSAASAWQHGLPNANIPGLNSRLSSYVTLLVAEWLIVFVIWLANGAWRSYRTRYSARHSWLAPILNACPFPSC